MSTRWRVGVYSPFVRICRTSRNRAATPICLEVIMMRWVNARFNREPLLLTGWQDGHGCTQTYNAIPAIRL